MRVVVRGASTIAIGRFPGLRRRAGGARPAPRWASLVVVAAGLGTGAAAALGRHAERRGDTGGAALGGPPARVGAAARRGYGRTPEVERFALTLLSSSALTIALARIIAFVADQRRSAVRYPSAPKDERRRPHHFMVGGVAATLAAAPAVRADGRMRRRLAAPLGAGLGLVLDEVPLLVKGQDVYWRREQVAIAECLGALAASGVLALRALQRGTREQS